MRVQFLRANQTTSQGLIVTLAVLFVASSPLLAIEGLKLQIYCPDVVLSWPSVEGENYIVQHRETLSTNTPWVTLTNYLPAETGTNMTYFVHSNRVDCPVGQVFGMMLSSGGESTMMKAATLSLSAEERTQIKQAREEARLIELYQKCELEGRLPYEWELKNHPPLPPTPEEIRAKILKARDSKVATLSGAAIQGSALLIEGESLGGPFEIGGGNDPQPENGGGGSGNEPTTGFYQVVKDGVRIWGATNIANPLVLSGTVNIPFEAGNADLNNGTNLIGSLSSAILLVDGVKFAGDGTLTTPPGYPWQFTMDTAYLENGDHSLQVAVFWFDPNGNTDGTESIFPSRYSDPITISVSNSIYYPQWEEDVGEPNISAYFLKTANPDAAYQITITDTNGAIVKILDGYATRAFP